MDNSHLTVHYGLRTRPCYPFNSMLHTLRRIMSVYNVYNYNHHSWEKLKRFVSGRDVRPNILGLYGRGVALYWLVRADKEQWGKVIDSNECQALVSFSGLRQHFSCWEWWWLLGSCPQLKSFFLSKDMYPPWGGLKSNGWLMWERRILPSSSDQGRTI